MKEEDFDKIEVKSNICINVFGYENELVFPVYISHQKSEDSMDLLLLIDDNKSHYVYIKDFNRFMFQKTKNKNKKWLCRSCLQCFSNENAFMRHKGDCLSINGAQTVEVEGGTIEFENYFKQIPVSFTIYADFECNLKGIESYEGSYTKKYNDIFLVVLLAKLFVLIIDLLSQLLFTEVKILPVNLLNQFLRSMSTGKK